MRAMISAICASAVAARRRQVPAPRCPPPPNLDISSPTFVPLVRLKIEWPTAAATCSRLGPQWTRSEMLACGKRV